MTNIEELIKSPLINKAQVARLLCGKSNYPANALEQRIKRGKILLGTNEDAEFLSEMQNLFAICAAILDKEAETIETRIRRLMGVKDDVLS